MIPERIAETSRSTTKVGWKSEWGNIPRNGLDEVLINLTSQTLVGDAGNPSPSDSLRRFEVPRDHFTKNLQVIRSEEHCEFCSKIS